MSDKTLKPIWEELLKIYKIFADICGRHNLRYYVTDGSAIGAVRHKGFIPWDDDFDVSMPRPDYDKFMRVASDELPSHLQTVDWKNTPEFPLLFGKIQNTSREVIQRVEQEAGIFLSGGLYIDIFPIDGYPESRLERMMTKMLVIPLSCITRFRCTALNHQTKKGCIVWLAGLFFNMLCPWMSGQSCKRICEGFLLRHPFKDSRYTGRASLRLTLLNRAPIPKEWWSSGECVSFCGMRVPVPENYDAYLRLYYGNYMVHPPVEKQTPSHQYSWRCPWWLGPTNQKEQK